MSYLLAQASAHRLPLRDESVQTVVTSPPYWGLRAYTGEQAFVWGGEDHDHEWDDTARVGGGKQNDEGKRWQHTGGGVSGHGVAPSSSCPCGAWYGALGLEPTPELYVEHIVEVFREVRRVLRPDGTLWLNLGDSYAQSGMGGNPAESEYRKQATNVGSLIKGHKPPAGLKPKDLVGIPWRVAFALQADGWYLRSDIIWAKPNPMPESVTDRPSKSHEYVFLLSKSGDSTYWTHRDHAGARSRPMPDYRWQEYAWDDQSGVAIRVGSERVDEPPGWQREEIAPRVKRWRRYNLWDAHDYFYDADAIREDGASGPSDLKKMREQLPRIGGKSLVNDDGLNAANASTHIGQTRAVGTPGIRNARSVWTIATHPYSGAHFATFPEPLVERCIKAGSAAQACGVCGAPWQRMTELSERYAKHLGKGFTDHGADLSEGRMQHRGVNRQNAMLRDGITSKESITTGFGPTCEHEAPTMGSVVLDPFNGSGTTGRVALRLGRRYVGLDLSREYVSEQALRRIDPVAASAVDFRAGKEGAQGALL